jgi:exopolyphosphatase/guanosine-5'-triphosphate,3'-diphosphate pyrophosphatase
MLCERLGAQNIITSKAGVREGVYLSDILRNNNHKFPHNFNISIKSLIDRFAIYDKNISQTQKISMAIYDQTYSLFDIEAKYRELLHMASRLLLLTRRLNIYSNSDMSFGFLVENLNFAISHEDKILISLILKYAHQKSINEKEIKKFHKLLPDTKVVEWLSFILSLTICINKNKKIQKIDINYKDKVLSVKSETKMFLCSECIKKLKKPASFAIVI